MLDEERKNLFKFFATGRANAKYCMVSIETKRRQVTRLLIFVGFDLIGTPQFDMA